MWCCLYYTIFFSQMVLAKPGFGPTDQDWGFATIRGKGHMFWWLHYTTANVDKYTDKPLIIWLQGGPGISSTGTGNFGELGPIDSSLQPRNTSWVQWANVLFVDNPVGVGFGYVEDNDLDAYPSNNTQIAQDFLIFLKQFYESVPEFKKVPLYIFCESYGGKMTAEIALVIDKATKNGDIEANLKGVGLGDSWISPVDSILTYAPYLLAVGHIDQQGYDSIMEIANNFKTAMDKNDIQTAKSWWDSVTFVISMLTHANLYNILERRISPYTLMKFGPLRSYNLKEEVDLTRLMNNQVAKALNISQEWKDQSYPVYDKLADDFLKPVTKVVEQLLNETDITVAVYNGQLDLIVDNLGTMNWVQNLHFKGKDSWDASSRNGFAVDGYYQGYVKKQGNFAFYWVDRAGHMVPKDNPSAMYYILKDVTNNFKV